MKKRKEKKKNLLVWVCPKEGRALQFRTTAPRIRPPPPTLEPSPLSPQTEDGLIQVGPPPEATPGSNRGTDSDPWGAVRPFVYPARPRKRRTPLLFNFTH